MGTLSRHSCCRRNTDVVVRVFSSQMRVSGPKKLLPVMTGGFKRGDVAHGPLVFKLFAHVRLIREITSNVPHVRRTVERTGLPRPRFRARKVFATMFGEKVDVGGRVVGIPDLSRRYPGLSVHCASVTRRVVSCYSRPRSVRRVVGLMKRAGQDEFGGGVVGPLLRMNVLSVAVPGGPGDPLRRCVVGGWVCRCG